MKKIAFKNKIQLFFILVSFEQWICIKENSLNELWSWNQKPETNFKIEKRLKLKLIKHGKKKQGVQCLSRWYPY